MIKLGNEKLLVLLVVIYSLIEVLKIILIRIELIYDEKRVIDNFYENQVDDCKLKKQIFLK